MDVKFIVTAECRADNIDNMRSREEIAEMLERLLDKWCGIKAYINVIGLSYINEQEV